MTCVPVAYGMVCFSPWYRPPLADGTRVFMDWHSFCGPTFYRDRAMARVIEDWYEDPLICAAVEWFQRRGCRA